MEPIDLTIIVPVYNAAKYLRECLDSICAQTYFEWKCVCVNDGSTDNSQDIIEEYCKSDSRFTYMIKDNEGSAAKARYFAIERISSKWIMSIDADDAIEPMFLEKIIKRYWETGADCVTGRLIRCEHELEGEVWRLPMNDFDMDQILSGRECCLRMLGGWTIGGKGIGLRERALKIKPGPYMNSDEFNQRQASLLTDRHAFVDAHYYYRANTATSYGISVRMFDRTLVDMQLEQFVYDNFPEREDKIRALAWQRLFNLIYLTADYNIHKKEFTSEEREKAVEILRRSYRALNRRTARQAAPFHALLLAHSFALFNILATAYVRYKRSHGGAFYYR